MSTFAYIASTCTKCDGDYVDLIDISKSDSAAKKNIIMTDEPPMQALHAHSLSLSTESSTLVHAHVTL